MSSYFQREGDDIRVDGRYLVTVEVECLDERVRKLVEPTLKDGTRKVLDKPVLFHCDVRPRSKDIFISCLVEKSKETRLIWKMKTRNCSLFVKYHIY